MLSKRGFLGLFAAAPLLPLAAPAKTKAGSRRDVDRLIADMQADMRGFEAEIQKMRAAADARLASTERQAKLSSEELRKLAYDASYRGASTALRWR